MGFDLDQDRPLMRWRDFPRAMKRLSGAGRERLMLAALLERAQAACAADPAFAGPRRDLAALRRRALERALELSARLPACPPVEEALRLEQLEADLTAALRALPGAKALRPALDFSLLEETDQLYRFAHLLDGEQDAPAEHITGGRIEITPGRPCIAAHRHPRDSAFPPLDFGEASQAAILAAALMAALQRQAAILYAQRAADASGAEARALFAEMALIEEQHASQYESLWDPRGTPLQSLALRTRALRYAYDSLLAAETGEPLRGLWRVGRAAAQADLESACALADAFGGGAGRAADKDDPPPFLFGDTSALARALMPRQVTLTMLEDSLVPSGLLPPGCRYFAWQRALNGDGADTPSHQVVRRYAARYGTDYRFERGANPIEALQNRREDNVTLGCEPARSIKQPAR